MTQIKLAKMCKMNRAYLSLIESGHNNPSIDLLENIAKKLKTQVAFLFIMSIDLETVPDNKKEQVNFVLPTLKDIMLSLTE